MDRGRGLPYRSLLVAVLAAAAALAVLRLLHYELRLLRYWPQWEFYEAWSLHHALLLARGEPLYRIREAPPLVVPQYGFVYPALVAPLVALFGPSLAVPRAVSLVCVALLVAATALALRHGGASWTFTLIGAGLLLMKANWWRWLTLCRPDALGSLLLFLALLVHWRWPRRWTAMIVSVLLLVAAFFTKVYFVLGAITLFLTDALVRRDGRWAWRFALTFTVTLAGALAGALAATGGLYRVFTFEILSVLLRYSAALGLVYLLGVLASYLPLWMMIAASLARKTLDLHRYDVLVMHLVVATPLVALLLTNDGGGGYYWYVVLPALVVVGTLALAAEVGSGSRLGTVGLVLTLASLALSLASPQPLPSPALAARWEALRERVARTDGLVMNSNLTAILSLGAGKDLYDEAVGFAANARWLRQRYGHHLADPDELIRGRAYALLLDPEPLPSIDRHYLLTDTVEVPGQFGAPVRIHVYEPRPAALQ